ncbi:MAG: TAXI family TRAP transporter solute-binding subunit [Desulfuromusa sp.]|nr:TAXI family TRAP transporter solute-binding subunit [Desulfuromusa sp.]
MKRVLTRVVCSAFLALLLVYTLPATSIATEPITTITTGGINGVYYSAGGAVAKMFNKKRHEFGGWMANQASKGSLENIDVVLSGDVDFGISQANFLYFASNGIEYFDGQQKNNLRAVLGLYVEDLTIIAAMDAEINIAKDLKGKRVNIGVFGSSDEETSVVVLEKLGIDPAADLELFNYPTYEASERLQADDIDAYFYTVGHPNLSVMEATEGDRKVRIIPFDQTFISGLAASRPYLSATTVDTQYYDKLEDKGAIPTVGIKSILFTRADVDEETVYRVVKQVMDNLKLFRMQHPAFAKLNRMEMSEDVIVPLHSGAARYFRETGLIQ